MFTLEGQQPRVQLADGQRRRNIYRLTGQGQ